MRMGVWNLGLWRREAKGRVRLSPQSRLCGRDIRTSGSIGTLLVAGRSVERTEKSLEDAPPWQGRRFCVYRIMGPEPSSSGLRIQRLRKAGPPSLIHVRPCSQEGPRACRCRWRGTGYGAVSCRSVILAGDNAECDSKLVGIQKSRHGRKRRPNEETNWDRRLLPRPRIGVLGHNLRGLR